MIGMFYTFGGENTNSFLFCATGLSHMWGFSLLRFSLWRQKPSSRVPDHCSLDSLDSGVHRQPQSQRYNNRKMPLGRNCMVTTCSDTFM